MEEKSVFESFELEVGKEIRSYLKETASWTYFLSILGFIGIGFMFIMGLYFMFAMNDFSNGFGNNNPYQTIGLSMTYMGLFYILIGVLYIFPVWYLFNFSRKMKTSLQSKDNTEFIAAFSNLKSHYKFMGIFAIVIISIYLLLFLIGFAGALM